MSEPFFRIKMLPARQGDALWVEYGEGEDVCRILIDGGPIGAFRALDAEVQALPEGGKGVELLVISHVDTDHIEGVIRLLAEQRGRWPIDPGDIWFNGWRHLREASLLGGREGDFLSALIRKRAFAKWNKAFSRDAVVVRPDQELPVVELRNGMRLTLLSPDPDSLASMADKWQQDVDTFGLRPGDLDAAWDQLVEQTKYHVAEGVLGGGADFGEKLRKQLAADQSLANGTSIAFLAEFAGKSCLFLADAHADVICSSLKRLIPEGSGPIRVDAVKMPHHGSRNNVSEELMRLIDAKHFLVSTDGTMYHHPDPPAIEAVIQWSVRKPVLWFNYRSAENARWEEKSGSGKPHDAVYPRGSNEGMVVAL
jgi:beta-lactamase superfamily II metal-dependent hydrolase